jgi:UDP-N-acetylmuramoyl-L-alanyl-D-glutamate--2,6-diaminopimelate ligase
METEPAMTPTRTRKTIGELSAVVPPGLHARVEGDAAIAVPTITHDTHDVRSGGMYACLRGGHHDGHSFAPAAVAAGASSLLVDHRLDGPEFGDVTQLVVADTRLALGPIAAAVNGDPSTALRVVGVTGTNGKTTTTMLLAEILRAAGDPTSVIGTLSGAYTTPEAPQLQTRLAELRDEGERSVVMEVSSHALALHRVDGTRFDAAVFTNLGRDHLGLHCTVEEYFRAKSLLFQPGRAVVGIVNTDDRHGRLLFDAAPIEMVPFSIDDASDIEVTAASVAFSWRGARLSVPLGGAFNVMNTIAAATTAAAIGIGIEAIVEGLGAAHLIPGRFERVSLGHGTALSIDVIVDYAHTPDGLDEVIAAAGALVGGRGRVIVVFGAGGDRDRAKRPEMGATAARLADLVVVTSDNPRSEDPAAIVAEILAGISDDDRSRVEVQLDRAAAIKMAITLAEPGDIVVIAGKGHETTQTIGDRVIPFDDREVARAVLAEVGVVSPDVTGAEHGR